MFFPAGSRRSFVARLAACIVALCLIAVVSARSQTASAKKSTAKKSTAGQHGLTQADVQKVWALHDDTLLANQIRLKGLAFEPEEDWVNQLQKLTNVKLSDMPKSAAELKAHIQASPDLDRVSAEAPALLDKAKEAAQKRDAAGLESLLHPELLKAKSKVYDLFDVANYRGHSLGKYASEPNRQVSVQFFQLTTSQVERVHYVYFSVLKGKVVLRDVKSGPEEAERFLRDEEQLAQSKLDLMFRALNDGDDAGVKMLCTDGLYQAIKDWGGDKHPGDRLTRGRKLDQVTVKTSVPLDQKSVRVVARISYPLSATKTVTFDADFERIGNDLKIVRVRDTDNKLVVFDPNIDNYLNRRYKLPDGPIVDGRMAMTVQDVFLSIAQIHQLVMAAIEDHNAPKVQEYAQTLIESDPTGGEGYGILAAADQMVGHFDDAQKDGSRAVERGATAYFVVTWHSTSGLSMESQFLPAVLAVSKERIQYLPAASSGQAPVDVAFNDLQKVEIQENTRWKQAQPFLKLEVMEGGKKKPKEYNFAAFGTTCLDGAAEQSHDLQRWPKGGYCGSLGGSSTIGGLLRQGSSSANDIPLLVPTTWRPNLMAVWRTIDAARKTSVK